MDFLKFIPKNTFELKEWFDKEQEAIIERYKIKIVYTDWENDI